MNDEKSWIHKQQYNHLGHCALAAYRLRLIYFHVIFSLHFPDLVYYKSRIEKIFYQKNTNLNKYSS